MIHRRLQLTQSTAMGRSFATFGAVAMGVLATTHAHAADAPGTAPSAPGIATAVAPGTTSTDAATQVGEVVVTGALRKERLQETPMAVTAVAPREFTTAGYKSPIDLQFLSPSVQVSVQGANAIYIRGSGTNNTNASGEQSVGLVIDGVLIGFTDDLGGDISDLDHIEVYRGPQGTQFAMNTSAGAVAILTNNPRTGVTSTNLHASYGEHNDSADYVTQNIPLADNLALRLTGSFQNRDGVFENLSLREKEAGRRQYAGRMKLLWEPQSKFSVLFDADIRQTDEYPNFPQAWGACGPTINEPFTTIFAGVTYAGVTYGGKALPPCSGALIGAIGSSGSGVNINSRNANSVEDEEAYRHTTSGGAAVTLSYGLGDYTLTSITAFRFISRRYHGPIGNGYYESFYLDDGYYGNQTSEEIRLASPAIGKLTYVSGIFFYDRDTKEKSLFAGPDYGLAYDEYPNTPYGQNVQISFNAGQNHIHSMNKSYAAYTDGAYHVLSNLQINAGVRFTHDDVFNSIYTTAVPGVYGAFFGSRLPYRELWLANNGLTWRIGPQYFITPNIQVYGTWAYGYKGPLIDASVSVLNPVKPEQNTMLETGVKSSWFDHRLTVDLTAFHEKYTNFQINVLNQQITPNLFQLGNALGAVAQGIELETAAQLTQDWRFTGSLSLDDGRYTDFLTSCWNALEPIKQARNGPNGCYVHPGQSTAAAQAKGTPMINTSKYTFRVGLAYNHTFILGYKLDADVSYFWRSHFLSAPIDPNLQVPGYGFVNVQGGVSTPNGKYRFGVYARNAGNGFFLAGRQAGNGGYTNVLNTEAVRTVGFNVDMRF